MGLKLLTIGAAICIFMPVGHAQTKYNAEISAGYVLKAHERSAFEQYASQLNGERLGLHGAFGLSTFNDQLDGKLPIFSSYFLLADYFYLSETDSYAGGRIKIEHSQFSAAFGGRVGLVYGMFKPYAELGITYPISSKDVLTTPHGQTKFDDWGVGRSGFGVLMSDLLGKFDVFFYVDYPIFWGWDTGIGMGLVHEI